MEKGPKDGYAAFFKKYGDFYGVFTQPMYDEIIYPILHPNGTNVPLSPDVIHTYLTTGNVPKSEARKEVEAKKKANKSMATVAAASGNAIGARNSTRATQKAEKAAKKASSKPKAATKGPAEATVPASSQRKKTVGQGGKETRGGGIKKKRHRKTQKNIKQ